MKRYPFIEVMKMVELKISLGITGDNAKHAGSTQPLLFSDKERAEWDWITGGDDDE